MDKLRILIDVLTGIIVGILLVIVIAVICSYFNIYGFKLYTVQSGSMEPKIHVGSVVVTTGMPDYFIGDIISFKLDQNVITHRIFSTDYTNNTKSFITKGDANKTPDIDPVPKQMVLGKVIFTIPYFGYPIAFARTQTGLIVLIIIPSTLVIYSEILNIKNETAKILKKKYEEKIG